MRSKLISLSFLTLSIIFLVLLFQVNYNTKYLEKKIRSTEKKIQLLKESNKILKSEYSAYTNPEHIKKLSFIYLNYEIPNHERIAVFSEKNFIKKINEFRLIVPTSINNNAHTIAEEDSN